MRISDWSSDVCSSDLESGDPRPALLVEQHGAPCSPGLDPTGAVAADTNGRALTIRPSVPNLQPKYLGSPQSPVGIQRKRRRGLLQHPATDLAGTLRSGIRQRDRKSTRLNSRP